MLGFMSFLRVLKLLIILRCINTVHVGCLNFSYPSFSVRHYRDFSFSDSSFISHNAIQVTPDDSRESAMRNVSGRVLYNQRLKLWDGPRGTKSSFNSTFVFNIDPVTSPGGEGLAFILTEDSSLPNNSYGKWLGIVNSTTVSLLNIVAIEFDTKKSDSEDIDDNHVGVNINSISSINQEPLINHGVKSFHRTGEAGEGNFDKPVLNVHLDLSTKLPADVWVGFSVSTGENIELNYVKSWTFTSLEIRVKNSINLLWLWILIPVLVLVILFSWCFYFFYWKRRNRKKQMEEDELEVEQEIQSLSTAPQKFRLQELKDATRDFNVAYKLGKGGFGMVYKGILNNREVAVKRILKNTRHGKQDFLAEVTTISNLHHRNLVKLFGWYYESNELLLVYEIMPNGSLDKFIFQEADTILSWERRHGIICGVARALDYLHYGCERRVLHRDVKPSNIMLDSEFNARLGDFGLARTIQVSEKTHHSTKEIAGTPRYMAPEIFHTRKATVETDVYAFGVLILEVVCGRKPDNEHGIVDWVWENYGMERIGDVVDVRLNGEFKKDEAECIVMLGLACCHPNPYERPLMSTALQVLTGEATAPVVPKEKPAFMWPAMPPPIRQELDASISGGKLTITLDLNGR
ncbi:hypothetical protein SLEP1_g35227 [Rubroshorea leprosula]|uniref:Protein kinase domain-containing protein n=1 Tax=Rubroshorea leprosula TaxID=152421 RepID=A0AAV5KMU9_9ROSI|nr:hypothetical protein SLEP1_g35227 [Rubroshorea leprosula]